MTQRARAIYDYSSSEPLDLAFSRGDIIEVKATDDSGWWTGTLNGKTGQFPGEYVQILQDEPAKKRKPPPPPNARTAEKLVVRVLWNYEAQATDELSVKAEDILEVTSSADPDWWLSTKNGKTGIVPKNYTEFVSSASGAALLVQAPANAAPQATTFAAVGPPPPPSMISSGGAYSLGADVPIWYHPAFVGLVADRHRDSTLYLTTAKDEFEAFSGSFQLLGVAMERVASRLGDQFASRFLMRALLHGGWIASNLPLPGVIVQMVKEGKAEEQTPEIDFDQSATTPQDPSERFYLFLHNLVGRIREMRSGDAMIIPCGWTVDSRTRRPGGKDIAAFVPARGRFVCVLSLKGEAFDFSILQDSDESQGIEYHPSIFDAVTGKTKRATLHFENIPRFKLADSSFWFMLFRMVVFPHDNNTPNHLYDVLLPYLNQVPLRTASMSKPKFFFSTTKRPGDDLSKVHLVKKAIRCALVQHFNVAPRDAKRFILELKRELTAMTLADVNVAPYINQEEANLARLMINQCINAAAKLGDDDASDMQRTLTEVLETAQSGNEMISKKILQGSSRFPVKINTVTAATRAVWGSAFPLFGRFRRDTPVEQLAGTRTLPSILRPVQITLVPDSVSSFHDVAVALRHCANVCTLLDNQKDSIKNTYCLRVALIMHLFTHVIPLPAPPTSKSVCFWAAPTREMRYETQADLLRSLELVGRHFTSAALSLHVTRSFDAARVVTMACIATVADAVARKIACDVPSQFSLHLSGQAEGPVYEFGFEMGYFLEESGFLEFTDPYMCAARTQMLDYFHAQRKSIDEAHTIFRFEQSMDFSVGDARLVDQLCIQMGFPRSGSLPKTKAAAAKNPLAGAAQYLTGEDPLLIDNYPELALYRDIVFLFKSLMTPTSSALPPVKAWIATDARLYWKVAKKAAAGGATEDEQKKKKKKTDEEKEEPDEEEELDEGEVVDPAVAVNRDLLPRPVLEVSGFGQKELKCAAFARTYVSKELSEHRSTVRTFLGFFGLGADDRPRAPPSGANPSNLVNETIVTEDDVLHVRNLPDFGGRMGARDCELLLSYLTAPYIRIPLVLQFFAEQTRINCLSSYELQNVLDACLFEPSLFMSETEYQNGAPETVPVLRREQLGTPAGLLFNELQRSPHVLLRALEDMLFYSLELDVGKFSPQSSGALLYVTRLIVRVLAYLDFICQNAQFLTEGKPSEGGARQRVRGVGAPDELPKPVWNVLEKARNRLRHKLETLVYETLENWCEGALKTRDMQLACVLHAHMAILFAGRDKFDYSSACSTLAAFVFVTSNFRFTVESHSGEKKTDRGEAMVSEEILKRLGVNQVELFTFFQQQRPKLMRFFAENPDDRNEVMEAVVRVVTLNGTHKRRAEQTNPSKFPPNRNWCSLDRALCEGRFVPDTEMPAYRAALAKIDDVKDFEEWLRQVTTLAVDTEINVQLGEFTLKKNPMQLLPDEFFAMEDFKHVIGVYDPSKGDALQCAEVSNTTNRQWWRLVGKRHDVQLWKPDIRTGIGKASTFKRAYPGSLTAGEKWIAEVLEPYRASMFPDIPLFLPSSATFDNQHFARLTGLVLSPSPDQLVQEDEKKGGKKALPTTLRELPPTLIELVVFKDPPVVHVYHVVEHGRRFYSCLTFSSDCFFTFGDFPPEIASKKVMWPPGGAKLAAGRVAAVAFPPASSLVITRNISATDGVQMFIPPKFLFGLLPHALLERYDFWQSVTDESLVGVPKDPQGNTKILVSLFKDKTVDETGYGGSMAYAVIKRVTTLNDGNVSKDVVHTLLNPLYAPPTSPLRTIAMLFGRLDNLSHILMWTADESVRRPNDSASIDLVELPRVRLSFKAKPASATPDAELLFLCEEHSGLFVSSRRDAGAMRLIDGLQCGILLENDENDVFILLPATSRPTRQFRPSSRNEPPCSDLLLDPAHPDWLNNLRKDVRHYLCPIHSSRTFLFTPTLASALYLMLLRLAARQYSEAFLLAEVCVSDTPLSDEEKQSWTQLGEFKDDQSPDAHAVRLKITLATRGSRDAQPLPWSPALEYAKYCTKFGRVSAACRLTMDEELALLASGEVGDVSIGNRRVFLTCLHTNTHGADLLAPLFKTEFPQFDEVMDATALEDRKNASSWKNTLRKFASAKPISYSRPDDITGSQALRLLEKYIRAGVSVRGTGGTVGFVFMYEWMTGTLALRILNDDSCYNWGCLFLRLLPPKKFQKQQTMTSVLRILSYNPKFAAVIPKYEDTRKHKISIMFKGSNVIQKLLENCNQFLRSQANDVQWPKFDPMKRKVNPDFPAKLILGPDSWRRNRLYRMDYRISNLQNARRVFRVLPGYEQDWPMFRDRPLQTEFARFVAEKTRRQRALHDLVPKRLDVVSHPSTRSKAARDILQRLAADDTNFCQDSNSELEPEMVAGASFAELRVLLESNIANDSKIVKEQIAKMVTEVNQISNGSSRALGYALRKVSGQEVSTIYFDYLVGLSMCDAGDADLLRTNPFLPDFLRSTWQDLMAGIMFRANRVKQAYRALKLVMSCEATRDQIKQRLAMETLARELAMKRHYIGPQGEYDPRFLAFEFTNGLVLRKAQVELVRDFVGAMRRAEGARCQQMIMGSGKTTVVGPLLALLLGDGRSLIVQVVPPALLEFSRSVMRECFSSAIFQKPVYTFQFDRVSMVTEELVKKLRLARDSRSIVCTTPTAIKSFFLKMLEAAHNLDNARVMRKGDELDEGQGIRGALQRTVFGYSRLKKKRALDEQEKAALRKQLGLGLEIVNLFKTGALLLDEVDLILHPLKSELNWPIGARLPLDFTYSKSRGVHGLRWQVPFHLLDALLCAASANRLAWASDDSREARLLIEKLTAAIREGEERRLVQRTPHFVLLSKMFYTAKMKPLLGRWLVLFLIQKGVRGVRDDHLTNYLTSGPRRADPEAIRAVKEHLSDENVKLLNLAHDWLETFCPFVVSRIDRVKFGLLTKEDLDRLAQFGPVPKNRKLMAVPFVGKDVPSRASEFSHPDVLIGLTTLAYRYEGLRYSDFTVLIRALRERLDDETGPYHIRPSGAIFIRWVELAGGRVRGTRLEERREQVEEIANAAAQSSATNEARPAAGDEFDDLWPLQLLDVNDAAQMDIVYRLLRKLPHAALFYLHEIIFPECLQHQGLKLSACGQELGGTMLFMRRMGFSGTPSDLLPVELGSCQYERGSDGRMVHYLSDPQICSLRRTGPDWTVVSLLQSLCEVDESGRPIYHALIDTGALITGMGNDEVAAFLLKLMPRDWVDGVVFLDGDDRKMVVLRSEKVVPLDRCGIDLTRRFTFYDQVHTTGMDIRQAPSARAALTLGKDMVFRDYAQGAFRMRQIAKGQTIELIIVPEVEMLIQIQCAAGRGIQLSGGDLDTLLQSQRMLAPGRSVASVQLLQDVVSWLVINTCIAEKVQFNLLAEQSCNNVWRKRAFERIEIGSSNVQASNFTQEDVDAFRERIDYSVENTIPKQKSFVGKLEQNARERIKFLTEQDRGVIEMLLADARESETRDVSGAVVVASVAGVEGDGSPEEVAKERAFNAEQVQEQEQEQEQQVEQEQEKEEERAEEDLQEEFVKKKYSRDDETARPWRVEELTKPTPPQTFFQVSQFAVHKSVLESIKPIRFPESMFLSRNYYDQRWTLSTFRRLKNVICILEYVPDPAAVIPSHQQNPELDPITLRNRPPLDNSKNANLQRAFAMFDAANTSALDGGIALEVVKAMDVDITRSDFVYLQKCFQFADQDRSGTLNFNEFRSFVERRLFYQAACHGRFYVALSLQEAESLRTILHRDNGARLGKSSVALHSLASGSVLDCTMNYTPVSEYQDAAFTQLFRFMDSEVAYDERSIGILIRALQENECALRRTWFEDVRECRRRPRKYAVMDRPVARILTTPHEFLAFEYRATVVRVKELIYRRGMFITDAFRAFDANRDGLLSCSELYGALTWLGLGRLTEDQIHAMMRTLDEDKDGQLSMLEFRKAFGDAAREEQISKAGLRATVDFDGLNIPPRPMRELFEEIRKEEDIVIPPEEVEKFRIKLKPPQSLEKAWSSQGSLSEMEASIWRPDLGDGSGGLLRSNRVQLCLGYYAVKGQDRPSTGGGGISSLFFASSGKESEYTTIEIKDEGRWGVSGTSAYMTNIVEKLFPHPVRYQQLWGQPRGSPLFAWRGVPSRKEFVCMGVIVTTTEDPPPLSEMRCVPRHWCVKAEKSTVFVWKDAGATGGKKGSIYNINSMGLCSLNEGHELIVPESGFWELKERAFHITAADLEIVKGPATQKPQAGLVSASSSAVPGSSALLPENAMEDPNRPSLDANRFRAPATSKPDVHKYPVQVFANPSEYLDDRRNVNVVGFTVEQSKVKTQGIVPTKAKIPPPPSQQSTGVAETLQPARTSTSSAAVSTAPPRPQKPSTAVAVPVPVSEPSSVASQPHIPLKPPAALPAAAVSAGSLGLTPVGSQEVTPPPRPGKPSSQAAVNAAVVVVASEQQQAVPPPRPAKPSSQVAVPGSSDHAQVPPPRPSKPSSQVTVQVPPATVSGGVPPPRPNKPSSQAAVTSGADELAAALARRKEKSEGGSSS